MNEYLEMHKRCLAEVIANDYYLSIFRNVEAKYTDIQTCEDPKIINSFWNDFWWNLPDSLAIHRQPFNLICDLCEYE